MAVNESVYGLKENWTPRNLYGNYPENYPEDEKLKIANFLNNPLTTSGDTRNGCCLGSAFYAQTQSTSPYYNPNLDLGQPIPDMSVCFTGLSGFSPYLNIRFISTRTDQTNDEEYQLSEETTQTYDVFNFCYSTTTGASFGDQQKCFALDKNETVGSGDSELNVKLYDTRLYPEPINKGVASRQLLYCYTPKSSRNTITFVTQLPVKHIVLVPLITARDTNDNTIKYDLKTYLADYKEDYPRIVDITLRTYSSNTDTHFNYGQQLAINNYNIYTALANYYGQADSGATHRIKQTNLVIPFIPCQGIKIGGCITGDDLTRYQKTDSSVLNHVIAMYAYIDCVRLRWDSYSGDGTPMTNHYCFCDATRYTDEEIYDSIYKATACFGLFFTDSSSDVYNMYLDDDRMCLGILRDGIGYGQWSAGVRNREQPQWNWKDMSESPYVPQPQNPIPPSNPTTFNPVTLANGGLKRYVLDGANMASFGRELWNVIDTTNPDELIQNQTLTNFLTNNPLDCIVSIKRFPLADMSQGTAVNPMLGKVKIPNVLAYPFDASSTILSCGSLAVPRFFNDFRDYMVQYELILPFCGTLSLDAESITGKTIDIKYAIDYTTGTCTAWILTTTSDGAEIVIDSANGNCCIDIPMSGVQTATLTGQIYNANENLKTAKFNTIISGVTGVGDFVQNVREHNTSSLIKSGANLINDIHNIKKAEWNIKHTEIPLKMIGASSGCNSFQIELTPRLTAYAPKTVVGFNYADYLHTVGASVCDSCTIGNYSGYVEVSNIDLSGFTATTTEKTMITNLLANGVYL